MKDSIKLTIPSKPEFISVVRLTSSSIANHIGMDIDCIEDIKVSIAEACINAMLDEDQVDISFNIYEDKLVVEVLGAKDNRENLKEEDKAVGLGTLIIKSLMDEVVFNERGVEMTKYIEDVLL